MAISIHGVYENPTKSPWNFEKYQSGLERRMMAYWLALAGVLFAAIKYL